MHCLLLLLLYLGVNSSQQYNFEPVKIKSHKFMYSLWILIGVSNLPITTFHVPSKLSWLLTFNPFIQNLSHFTLQASIFLRSFSIGSENAYRSCPLPVVSSTFTTLYISFAPILSLSAPCAQSSSRYLSLFLSPRPLPNHIVYGSKYSSLCTYFCNGPHFSSIPLTLLYDTIGNKLVYILHH